MTSLLEFPFQLDSVPEIRAALAADGAVVLRGVLDPQSLDVMRAEVDAILVRHELARPSDDGLVPLVDVSTAPDGRQVAAARDLSLLTQPYTVPHDERVRAFWRAMFEAEPFGHPFPGVRVFPPSTTNEVLTIAHQDFAHVPGSTRALTMWVPVHAVPAGVLELARGSHLRGFLSPDFCLSAAEMSAFDWCSASLAAGDAILFTALTVHRAPSNASGRFRSSFDFRSQPLADPIPAALLGGDSGMKYGLTWDEIYARLPETWEHRYYWTREHPPIATAAATAESTNEILEKGRLARFREGDVSQLRSVQWIRANSNDIGRRIEAKKLLARHEQSR